MEIKKVGILIFFLTFSLIGIEAQKSSKKVVKKAAPVKTTTKKAATKESTPPETPETKDKNAINSLIQGITGKNSFSADEVGEGLKEALQVGAKNAALKLNKTDGFFGNSLLKIMLPPEAALAETKLRNYGFGKQVDNVVLTMNRAAEDASAGAVPIFVDAIKGMSFSDALAILKGSDTAATSFLRNKTTEQLTTAFKPIVQQSLDKVSATAYWSELTSMYNKIPFVSKIDTDLAGYVTSKALVGMFMTVAEEEQKIRKDPVAQTTDILKKIFGK